MDRTGAYQSRCLRTRMLGSGPKPRREVRRKILPARRRAPCRQPTTRRQMRAVRFGCETYTEPSARATRIYMVASERTNGVLEYHSGNKQTMERRGEERITRQKTGLTLARQFSRRIIMPSEVLGVLRAMNVSGRGGISFSSRGAGIENHAL